jgi:pimeloyl-ACP methyl ester carboxylesterase
MRFWMVPLLLLAAAVAAILNAATPAALAQDAKLKPGEAVEETFLTADGIQLHGKFTKAATDQGNAPVVILLYPPGKDNNMGKGDWTGLANKLSAAGYNVFQFDWRGHGKSTDIKDTSKFWNLPNPQNMYPNPWTGQWNTRFIKGAPNPNFPNKKIKNELAFKDIADPVRYAPTLIVDLAAVRYHLDNKNDAGDLNTSSIYLIGADSAATIGMAWLATEWNRPAFVPNPNQLAVFGGFPTYKFVPQPLNGGVNNEGGSDISGAVWLSATRPTSVPERLLRDWVSTAAPKLRENNPMLFLYGENDTNGKRQTNFFYNEVLVAKPPPSSRLTKIDDITFEKAVKGTKLAGVGLLGNNNELKTEDTIIQFLAARQKDRAKLIRKNRGFTEPWSIQLAGPIPIGFGF